MWLYGPLIDHPPDGKYNPPQSGELSRCIQGEAFIVGTLLRTAWDRLQIIGQSNGEYVARVVTFVMYYTVLIPFALIARYLVEPLETRGVIKTHWRARKDVATSVKEARSQF